MPKRSMQSKYVKSRLKNLQGGSDDGDCSRFATRADRFMDAYEKGLNGRQAAWAARKYRGHRVLPQTLMDDMEKAKIH